MIKVNVERCVEPKPIGYPARELSKRFNTGDVFKLGNDGPLSPRAILIDGRVVSFWPTDYKPIQPVNESDNSIFYHVPNCDVEIKFSK